MGIVNNALNNNAAMLFNFKVANKLNNPDSER